VFYASIADGLLAASIMGAILFFSKWLGVFTRFEKIQLLIIWLLVGYSFAISLPTVIDRSLSFYILEKLDQRGGGIRFDAFNDIFTKEYVKEHRLVDVRLTEQMESGTIVVEGDCVKLTKKGRKIVKFSTMFRHNLLPKHRLLMGQYSSDLTNPFKDSIESPNYLCN
jgi:small basic protein